MLLGELSDVTRLTGGGANAFFLTGKADGAGGATDGGGFFEPKLETRAFIFEVVSTFPIP